MTDESNLRPLKLPFPGLFLRCGEQQVHPYPYLKTYLAPTPSPSPTLTPTPTPHPSPTPTPTPNQVHYLELPNPDPDTADARPEHGRDRRTAYSVKSLAPVRTALGAAGVHFVEGSWAGRTVF